MYPNPTVVQALGRARAAELRRSAEARRARRGEAALHRAIEIATRRTGWMLVGIGFRLAMPGRATNHLAARGQR